MGLITISIIIYCEYHNRLVSSSPKRDTTPNWFRSTLVLRRNDHVASWNRSPPIHGGDRRDERSGRSAAGRSIRVLASQRDSRALSEVQPVPRGDRSHQHLS